MMQMPAFTHVIGVPWFYPEQLKPKPPEPQEPYRRPLTEQEIQFIRDWYPYRMNVELAAMLKRSPSTIANKARRMGLKKTPETVRRTNHGKGRIQNNLRKT